MKIADMLYTKSGSVILLGYTLTLSDTSSLIFDQKLNEEIFVVMFCPYFHIYILSVPFSANQHGSAISTLNWLENDQATFPI
jgi:hypothetical protein